MIGRINLPDKHKPVRLSIYLYDSMKSFTEFVTYYWL